MAETHRYPGEASVSEAAAAVLALAALAALGLAAAATPAAAQAPDTVEAERSSIARTLLPEGDRVLAGPAAMEVLPDVAVFPLPITELPGDDYRTSLDAELRAGERERRSASQQAFGTPYRLWNGPVSFGQTSDDWISGGDRQLDDSNMGIFSADLLSSVLDGPGEPVDSGDSGDDAPRR